MDIFHELLQTLFCWQWKQGLVALGQWWAELLIELKLKAHEIPMTSQGIHGKGFKYLLYSHRQYVYMND